MSKLVHNINSAYLKATQKFSKKDLREKIYVFVEGYGDISFWRSILSKYETNELSFEISVPVREDLAKGKKVLLNMKESLGDNLILCLDSDFDYLLRDETEQSKLVNNSPYIFHTYTYSIENYLCYPPSLRDIAVKATKNDRIIFDFERFMSEYSEIVYRLFLWYVFAARVNTFLHIFTLVDFRNTVRLNYVDVENNGKSTLQWLKRQCDKREKSLATKYHQYVKGVDEMAKSIEELGVTSQNIYYFMHGHTLYDNVVSVLLESVCDSLKELMIEFIRSSTKKGIALSNELSNYKNNLRSPSKLMGDNESFEECPLFKLLESDIENFLKNRTPKHSENYNKNYSL
ncbi:MAG: DUF4435 domain-containing protein [Rikenellaceae bacterium]